MNSIPNVFTAVALQVWDADDEGQELVECSSESYRDANVGCIELVREMGCVDLDYVVIQTTCTRSELRTTWSYRDVTAVFKI